MEPTMPRGLLLLLLLPASFAAHAVTCETGLQRTVLQERVSGRTVRFDVVNPEAPAAFDQREQHYADWVRSNTPLDAVGIVNTHIHVIRKALEKIQPGPFRDSLERGLRYTSRIAAGELGKIGQPRCLDQLAFREYLRLVDLRQSPQEFMAYVFERGGMTVMVGDFDDRPDSPIGVQASPVLIETSRRMQAEGWQLQAHLHNHPLVFDNPYGDIGPIVPSSPDIASYMAQRPQQAWITDGREVLRLDRAEYEQLE